MKTAIVLAGDSETVKCQAESLSGFVMANGLLCGETEVWVLADEAFDTEGLTVCEQIVRAKVVRIAQPHAPERLLGALALLCAEGNPSLLLFGANPVASALAVRLAHRLGGSSCIGVRALSEGESRIVAEKAVYSNNLVARFALKREPFCIGVAKDLTNEASDRVHQPIIEEIVFGRGEGDLRWLISYGKTRAQMQDGLCGAKAVVAIGQGIAGREHVAQLEELAALLNGQLGASRPVVMNAWVEMERLVGASGAILAPGLCLAIAASGAAAFAVGIEKSRFIVAINRDASAPIFHMADVGVCADYREIVPELMRLMKQAENGSGI